MECFIATAEFPIVFTFFTFALLAAKAKQDIREKFVSYERTLIPSTLILLVFCSITSLSMYKWLMMETSAPQGTCRPGHIRALPGIFQIMPTHITRTGREDTWSTGEACPQTPYIAYACVCDVRIAYSVVTKFAFRNCMRIKCSVAKSCPGTHTALQGPMQGPHKA